MTLLPTWYKDNISWDDSGNLIPSFYKENSKITIRKGAITWNDLARDAFDGELPKSASELSDKTNFDYLKCERCNNWPSLASHIVKSFGFNISDNSFILGGHCPGYDMKLQDPYSMIKLSLMYGLLCGELWECYVNEYGEVEFIVVGQPSKIGVVGSLGTTYLSVMSITYAIMTDKIILTGYKPAQARRLTNSKSIIDVAAATTGGYHDISEFSLYYDPRTGHDIGDPGSLTSTNQAWKGVGDIDWDYTDALLSLFKVGKYYDGSDDYWGVGPYRTIEARPFETISGYAYGMWLGYSTDESAVSASLANNSPRIHSISTIALNSWWKASEYTENSGVTGVIEVQIPDSKTTDNPVGNFIDVQAVYVYGYPVDSITVQYDGLGNVIGALLSVSTQEYDLRSLSRGSDYIVVNKGEYASLVFANYVSDEYNGVFNTGVTLSIDPRCVINDTLRDGKEPVAVKGSIYPMGVGDKGYVIDTFVVVCSHDYPAISIEDSSGNLDASGAGNTDIIVAAIAMNDAPAPIVFANREEVVNLQGGSTTFSPGCHVIDQSEMQPDDDPKTVELFWDTQLQTAIDSLGPGDIQMTIPFLEQDQLCTVAQNILDIANEGRVEIPGSLGYFGYREIMFTCGPDAHPKLGQKVEFEGYTYYVNEINYSYQDSSQYVVNVTAGAKWVGSIFSNGWGESVNQLKVENVTREGRVVGAGNGPEFIVYIDGFGNIGCINTTGPGTIILQGDTVTVTLYNVPQGET